MRFWRFLLLTVVASFVVSGCTSDKPRAPDDSVSTSTAEPSATAIAAAPSPAATEPAVATPRGPWQVGEPIHLETETYADWNVTEVTAETVLPDRDTLDRDGGSFVWERERGRLLFIEGIQHLQLAPGLVDGRPIGIAFTALDRLEVRSVLVRLNPVEVVALPIIVNVQGGPFDARWEGPARAAVSVNRLSQIDGRVAPEGEYRLDLESAILTLVDMQRRLASSAVYVEASWRGGQSGDVSMVLVGSRRSLKRGADGLGKEVFGFIDRWHVSPDGSKLLMVGRRLAVYDLEEEQLWRLGGSADYGFAGWSPDGTYIAATVLAPFESSGQTLIIDADNLDAVASPDFLQSAADGLPLPPLEDHWAWRWRNATELLLMSESGLGLLDVSSGNLTPLLDDRQPYDTLAWDDSTSTIALSRLRGTPASILELEGAAEWADIPLLAASPHVGLFDMNWGAEGQWLALNTAPGRS